MKIHAADTKTTYTITLRSWEGTQWSPDCFDDLETNFPRDHVGRIPGNYATILSYSQAVKRLIEWWGSEVANANNDPEYCGDGLCACGKEWSLDVDETEGTVYFTTDREAGNIIEAFDSLDDARAAISDYYAEDKRNGDYIEGFYAITDAERITIE